MIKLVALDLDGTLLDSTERIQDKTRQKIESLSDSEINILLISGRHKCQMDEYIKELNMYNHENCYAISEDGLRLYHLKDNRLVFQNKYIESKECKTLIQIFGKECRFQIVTASLNYMVQNMNLCNYLLKHIFYDFFHRKYILVNFNHIKRIEKVQKIEKMIVYPSKDVSIEHKSIQKQFTVINYNNERIEIFNKETSKWTALNKFMHMKGFKAEDVLYFGDSENDYDCFLNLENTVAMENADETIKSVANFVTRSNDNEGVFWGIKKWGL